MHGSGALLVRDSKLAGAAASLAVPRAATGSFALRSVLTARPLASEAERRGKQCCMRLASIN
eukprot:744886-Pleurochrysis_carterae.AAC.2